jgi:hypothetical protein
MIATHDNKPIFLAVSREACKGLERPASSLEYPKDSPHMKDKYLVFAVTPAKNWDASVPLNDMFRAANGGKGPNYTTLTLPPVTQGDDYVPALIMDTAQLEACEKGADVRRVATLNELTSRFGELLTTGPNAAREAERATAGRNGAVVK